MSIVSFPETNSTMVNSHVCKSFLFEKKDYTMDEAADFIDNDMLKLFSEFDVKLARRDGMASKLGSGDYGAVLYREYYFAGYMPLSPVISLLMATLQFRYDIFPFVIKADPVDSSPIRVTMQTGWLDAIGSGDEDIEDMQFKKRLRGLREINREGGELDGARA